MAQAGSLNLSGRPCRKDILHRDRKFMRTELRRWAHPLVFAPSHLSRKDQWSQGFCYKTEKCMRKVPYRYRNFSCRFFDFSNGINGISLLKRSSEALPRLYETLDRIPLSYQLAPAVGAIALTLWGLEPLLRFCTGLLVKRNENSWPKSKTYYIFTSYIRPLLLWSCVLFLCRALNPVTMPSEASQAVKQRLLNFVKSFSTVLTFSFCISSLIRESQKYFTETNDPNDSRNMGFRFAGNAVYTGVWVAAVSLFMELLGFSTQKWLTAGGLGTVLLTLAGREIFTNFLSSVMIHATRPFVLNEWIQTRIQGYEVSGTVEHVGWWSPTVIRGEDREAVHIPNHKFTVSVVRNLSQKTHWRIKTHLAISHLDVNKISIIVADMRKVLAKCPQVEQRKLHRRIFLDNIDQENQALRILISCFVKTSHFEEYLCVKEAIILDLLRVISHHQARLATPIRTIHKVYRDKDLEGTAFSASGTNKTIIVIDPTTKINGEELASAKAVTSEGKGIDDLSFSEGPLQSEPKSAKPETQVSGETHANPKENSEESQKQKEIKGEENVGLNSMKSSANDSSSNHNEDEPREIEKNLVLGVAIDGPKRTLPIEEGLTASDSSRELTVVRGDKKDGQTPPAGRTTVDPHDK